MKILSAKQIHDWDHYTIAQQHITSLQLMERAAEGCANWIFNHFPEKPQFQIVCGKGNNGGDGLALARLLSQNGYDVLVFVVQGGTNESDDYTANLERLQSEELAFEYIETTEDFNKISIQRILVEALFGSGLNRPLTGLFAEFVKFINEQSFPIISIDVPAGMFTDANSKGNIIIKALYTLTFQSHKLCFMLADNSEYFGDVHVLNIGLETSFLHSIDTTYTFTDIDVAKSFYRNRKQFSHKGTYGHALLVAGNKGKMGAAVMSASACLRSGVGLLTCSVPETDFPILHIMIPEAMLVARGEEGCVSKYEVTGIGPGLGKDIYTVQLFNELLVQASKPMVIDADALNILSQNKSWMSRIPKGSILTPHPKEFDRLFGETGSDFERVQKAIRAANEYEIVIVLKGARTLVTDGNRSYFNSTGNNGMATGGSGDTLTGIITGLMAQKYPSFDAALVGVYMHGLSADLCLGEQSFESLLPMDMIQKFGKAFKLLLNNKGA